ncbi:putative neprosin activation peptide [Lupinus albus]|uniref:Putative neprosin activation peptide n=1 Tax=Lupinus albus TaxID=3870 RepID=A0A6A4P049_LUPAL|nr:putative neprosin activation peptide [Lupinus albus]
MARPCIHISMFFVVLLIFITSTLSRSIANQPIELDKLSSIRAQLEKINKPGVKTIKSPDGDIIDCVLFHEQPAFDLPELKDQITTLQLLDGPRDMTSIKTQLTELRAFNCGLILVKNVRMELFQS